MELLITTGNNQVDAILRGVVGIYERVMPGRIRSYYLTGSYTDRTAVQVSDIDLYIIVDGHLTEREREVGEEVRVSCCYLSPLAIDATLVGLERLRQNGHVSIQQGRLLYGEDILSQVGYPRLDLYIRQCMDGAYSFIARNRSVHPLPFPVPAPDPASPLLGYERRTLRAGGIRLEQSTKELVVVVGWIATALVAYQAGVYVEKKGDVPGRYRELIGDDWSDLVTGIFALCHARNGYRLSPEGPDMERLKKLCRQTLAFENYFLSIYHTYQQSSSDH